MTYVAKELFEGEHYLGKPADAEDKIITRRVNLVKQIPDFCGKNYTLLEIGCGNGATMLHLCGNMKSVHGVDIFDHTGKLKKEIAEKHISNCTTQVIDVEREDLAEKYDRLICFEVIEHFNDDASISRFHRWLKPGALCAFSVPNKWWIFETHGARLPLLPWNRIPFFSWLPTPLHERWANARIYTRHRFVKLLEDNGFEVMDVKFITAPMDVLKDGWLKRFVVKNIFNTETTTNPLLSTSIFVVARSKSST